MPRPLQPKISRRSAVATSIAIIDAEGLEAFSLPRLAKELNVRTPSLYHHFADKNEIMSEVARAIVRKTTIPRKRAGADWPEWFVSLSMNFRQAILRHSNAAPVLLQFLPRNLLIDLYEESAEFLAASGVPTHLHVLILDGMEKLSLGATLAEAMRAPATRATIFPNVDAAKQPTLAKALAENEMTARRLFEETIRSFLYGVIRNDAARHGTGAQAPVPASAPS